MSTIRSLTDRLLKRLRERAIFQPPAIDSEKFTTSTTLLFTLAMLSFCTGITAAFGFVGQVALELPYHWYGKEALASVGDRWVDENNTGPLPVSSAGVTVYYFVDGEPRHMVSSQLRGVERMEHDNLRTGSELVIVYLPGNTEEVMPKEVLMKAWGEIRSGLLGGLGIALPGALLFVWLKRSGRLGK